MRLKVYVYGDFIKVNTRQSNGNVYYSLQINPVGGDVCSINCSHEIAEKCVSIEKYSACIFEVEYVAGRGSNGDYSYLRVLDIKEKDN